MGQVFRFKPRPATPSPIRRAHAELATTLARVRLLDVSIAIETDPRERRFLAAERAGRVEAIEKLMKFLENPEV